MAGRRHSCSARATRPPSCSLPLPRRRLLLAAAPLLICCGILAPARAAHSGFVPTGLAAPPVAGSSLPDFQNEGATPQFPMYFNAEASMAYINVVETKAQTRAKELIDTDTYTSLNPYQWDLAQQAKKGASNYGHLPDAYSHIFLWPQRFEPGWANGVGIQAARIDVPHKWAYPNTCPYPGVENLLPPSPYKQLPYEQGRCDIALPQVVQFVSGDPVSFPSTNNIRK